MSCSSKSHLAASNEKSKLLDESEFGMISLQDSVINFGMRFLSTPYRYGGTSTRGFDCSGFTSHVYNQFGYSLERSSRDQARQFPAVSKKDLQTGDLVFFEGRSQNGNVGHVGIVTERKANGEFNFLHASVKRGVTVSSSDEPYYAARYLKAGRVVNNTKNNPLLSQQPLSDHYSAKNSSRKNDTNAQPKKLYDAVYHTVKKGENLTKIAKEYDIPISTLKHLNGLKSLKVKKGQRLLISEAVDMPEIPIVSIPTVHTIEPATSQNNQQIQIILSDNQTLEKAAIEANKAEIKPEFTIDNNPQSGINQNSEQKTAQETTEVKKAELKIHHEQSVNESNVKSIHTVSAGETLFSIARMNNISVTELKQLNNLISNTINAGQKLIVNKIGDNPAENNRSKTSIQEAEITHIVLRGETLYSLSRKYNCSVTDIKNWNLNQNDNLRVGDKIIIKRKQR